MNANTRYTIRTALIVALGGFLMGFDASVISGVVSFVETEFTLTKIELGWSVASLTLTATLAMLMAGPLSDRWGRKPVLKLAAAMFAVSAVASALAPTFTILVAARMLGGFGVGAALILAPMYIAEISPAATRGRMVSFNQLNIVIGISAAYFSNYLILAAAQGDASWVQAWGIDAYPWRWMLGVEAIPAILYFIALFTVPESPRWLLLRGRDREAEAILARTSDAQSAKNDCAAVLQSLAAEKSTGKARFTELLRPSLRFVMLIGISVAILQQITGINAVFFYAPMIFEQSGIGTDASFMQAILVGLTNLVFTVVAMSLIDKMGRRPLLVIGLTGITLCMLLLAYAFGAATYSLNAATITALPAAVSPDALNPLIGQVYGSDVAFREAVTGAIGAEAWQAHQSALVSGSISMNATLILMGILGFVASFAVSLGPVMWVLFSELFPNRLRGLAISFVGLINSAVSFTVQLVFPWELQNLGSSTTFAVYGVFALIGLVIVLKFVPETKGRSLEELEKELATA